MPIDGKLEKWRAAGITPQIVMTPVTGHGIDSPRDASAVIRLAYQGQDLYVQVLRFDDVVSFHQPGTKSHLQDTMEMALNGFFDGFQFSISHFTDTGATTSSAGGFSSASWRTARPPTTPRGWSRCCPTPRTSRSAS